MSTLTRSTIAAALVAMIAGSVPTWVRADDAPMAVQIVDALNKRFGVHPGFRANHAKGIVVEGSFKASPEAVGLSRSPLFTGVKFPVTVRFSDSSGLTNEPDASPVANPHGMAIKFHLPGSGESDIVVNAFKIFPVATAEDFRDLQSAAASSPPDRRCPLSSRHFLPATRAWRKPMRHWAYRPVSPMSSIFGIDAFVFTNKAGQKQAFRYIIAPEKVVHLSKEEAAIKSPDYLMNDLPARLAKGPVMFHIKAQLAAAGDPTNDATQAWPDDRKVVDLGVLTIERTVADSAAAEKKLLFLPGRLTDGIEPSDDPLIAVRDAAYVVSFGRRNANP